MSVLHPVLDVLVQAPILTVFLIIGLGTVVGQILLGPIRSDAVGTLLMGLTVDVLDPRLGTDLTLLRSPSLALLRYTVELAVGNTFFRDLHRQLLLTVPRATALTITGAAGGLYSHLTGVSPAMGSGAYAEAPTLPVSDAAIEVTGTQGPAVDYALAYPVDVVVTILIVAGVVGRAWPGRRDPRPANADGITATGVYLLQRVTLGEMKVFKEGRVRISYLERNSGTRVVVPGEELLSGDKVAIVGAPAAIESAMHNLGTGLHNCLAKDCTAVDLRRLTVSSTWVAGRTIVEMDTPGRFRGVITRAKYGDLDLLAHEDLILELSDRILAVVPSDKLEKAADWFGDFERSVVQIDAFSVGAGITLEVLLGLVTIPLFGGITLWLRAAAGPLVVGMVLERVRCVGPFVWGLPHAANSTIRQLELLFFPAAVELASGPDLVASTFLMTGLKAGTLAALIVAVNTIVLLAGVRQVGVSAQRVSGGLARFVGQPAILALTLSKRDNERIETRYATLFALAIIIRIVMVQVLVALQARNPVAVGEGMPPGRRIRSE